MDLDFKINEFEGPLDLLLHLIKESKMDIFNIKIEEITEQYLGYIEHQESMNLEIASEYLVLASELLEIKSKLLLPNEKVDEEDEEDPREELINRLLEYEAYKEITKTLKKKESIRQEIYTKAPSNISEYLSKEVEIQGNLTLDDLIDAFQKFLERKRDSRPLSTKVTEKEITVSSRRKDIYRLLKEAGKISFFRLFPIVTKEYIVVTFLAILEMAKNNELTIIQSKTFDDIICEVK
ncbi:MAG: segregation/condensation protein A [Bacilli bacterium]|nr:segregation/condensation protein A [Bacilli bacterium]